MKKEKEIALAEPEHELGTLIEPEILVGMQDGVSFFGMMADLEVSETNIKRDLKALAPTLAYASWTHGVDLQVEYPDRLEWLYRRGFGTQLSGKPGTTNWLHFPISTPVIVDGVRYNLDSVMLRFTTGSVASIVRHVHVYDGSKRIATYNNVNKTGAHWFERFNIPGKPDIFWGVEISLGVEFLPVNQSRQMWFISAGGDFVK